MRYVDGFRDMAAATQLKRKLATLGDALRGEKIRVMEVCGSHTMAIARYGVPAFLPPNVSLISGPGCPVCVTDTGYIDAAIELARRGVIIATFGDMMRVPGSDSTLAKTRAEGADIVICYSPRQAIDSALKSPDREVVFLAIGFETTAAPILGMLATAIKRAVPNLSILTAFKLVPPALDVLIADPEAMINAFLCPAHVSAIIGPEAYEPVAAEGIPCVIAGFEPLDILWGMVGILEQVLEGRSWVENQYNRVVRAGGNGKALALFAKHLEVYDATWRGMGEIPGSGMRLRPEFRSYDARRRHGVEVRAGRPDKRCRCGDVLKGKIVPEECPLFGRGCRPERPIGPCMVSSEGSCSASYKYQQLESA